LCNGTFTNIGCIAGAADDMGIDTTGFQLFGVAANRYYVFMIDGFNGGTGPFSIGIRSQPFITFVNDLTIENFNIFPNPASQSVHIHSDKVLRDVTITISDLTGKVVYQVKMNELSEMILDTHSIASGIYLLSIQNQNGRFQKKLCISRDN
jgi:hypothetical protein